jgi:hypothetical protein
MEAESDPVENAKVGEAGEPLLHLFGYAERVVLRPCRGGVLGSEGRHTKAEDESGYNDRPGTAGQRRQYFHWRLRALSGLIFSPKRYA